MLHRIYFSPGMFGFGRLASYDYFAHVERALSERFRAAGDDIETHVVHVSPTASIRRRAEKLAELVASTCNFPTPDRGPIHLVGHSTGGLDARIVASPGVSLAVAPRALAWLSRLASVTTMNTPHFGTPLATFFTTLSGERVLRALSALTVIALTVGSPSLSAASALVAAFGNLDHALGLDLKVLDRATNALLRDLDEARSREVREYIDAMTEDDGAMVQLMPQAMELFATGIGDRPGVLYQSTASMAPPPSPRSILRALTRPRSALSEGTFALLYGITSRYDGRHPCAAPAPDEAKDGERALASSFGGAPDLRSNDGVVPIRSQVWGKLVWAGHGDHLDVLGHFRGRASAGAPGVDDAPPPHVDWLCSGSGFDRERFASLMDAIAGGLVSSGRAMQRGAAMVSFLT
jgi:triacylglycerol lipase